MYQHGKNDILLSGKQDIKLYILHDYNYAKTYIFKKYLKLKIISYSESDHFPPPSTQPPQPEPPVSHLHPYSNLALVCFHPPSFTSRLVAAKEVLLKHKSDHDLPLFRPHQGFPSLSK